MSYETFYNKYMIVNNWDIFNIREKYDINEVIELMPDKSLLSVTDTKELEKGNHVPTYFNTSRFSSNRLRKNINESI